MHAVLCVPGSVGLLGCCELLEPGHRHDASQSPGTHSWEGGAVFPMAAALGARGQGPQAS